LAVLITICGLIYKKIAVFLVNLENHRDESSYEAALANMIYKFMFWNVYVSYFILAFWERNFYKLGRAVFTFMVFKQLGKNLIEYLKYSVIVKYGIYKVTKNF
jgi:hypothetical protein